MRYNPSLDGVRALSAIIVIAMHSHLPFAHGGMIGVDVFFVLSGYLITTILRDELQATERIDLKRFYLRRTARLMPPLLLSLAATYLVYRLVWPDVDMLSEVGVALIYMSHYDLALWEEPRHLSHTWSLSVEEHFYLMWPIFLILTRKLSDRALLRVLVWLFVAATSWRFVGTLIWNDWNWSYFALDSRLSGLILGGILAVGRWKVTQEKAVLLGKLALYGLGLFTILFVWGCMPVLQFGITSTEAAAAALILALTSGRETAISKGLAHPWLVYLGMLSYSIYLWHFGFALVLHDMIDPASTFVISLAASVAIAALSRKFVEKPVKDWINRLPAGKPGQRAAGGVDLREPGATLAGSTST